MSILGVIFFLLFIFIIVPILVTLVRAAFFVHRARKSVRDAFRGMDNGTPPQDDEPRHRRSKKIDPRDGEYVAYEEIAVSASETDGNGRHSTRYTVEQQIVDAEWEDIPDSK